MGTGDKRTGSIRARFPTRFGCIEVRLPIGFPVTNEGMDVIAISVYRSLVHMKQYCSTMGSTSDTAQSNDAQLALLLDRAEGYGMKDSCTPGKIPSNRVIH